MGILKKLRLIPILGIAGILTPVFVTTSCSWFLKNWKLQVDNPVLEKKGDESLISMVDAIDSNKTIDIASDYVLSDNTKELIEDGVISFKDYSKNGGKYYNQWAVKLLKADGLVSYEQIEITFSTGIGSKSVTIFVVPPEEDSYQIDYLYDITYTIMYGISDVGGDGGVAGTAWLLSRIGSTGYTYYMVTNNHVTQYRKSGDGPTQAAMYFNFNKTAFDSSAYPSHTFSFTVEDPYKFFPSVSKGIDLSVIKATFSTTGTDAALKARLDRYNAGTGYGALFGVDDLSAQAAIDNNFQAGKTKISPASYNTSDAPYYTAGYPWTEGNKKCKFEYHTLRKLNQSGQRHDTIEVDDIPHPIYPTGRFYDTSPQYSISTYASYMNHGASGSALMDKHYSIVAIYWGGWLGGSTFRASYSWIINTFSGDNAKYLTGTL